MRFLIVLSVLVVSTPSFAYLSCHSWFNKEYGKSPLSHLSMLEIASKARFLETFTEAELFAVVERLSVDKPLKAALRDAIQEGLETAKKRDDDKGEGFRWYVMDYLGRLANAEAKEKLEEANADLQNARLLGSMSRAEYGFAERESQLNTFKFNHEDALRELSGGRRDLTMEEANRVIELLEIRESTRRELESAFKERGEMTSELSYFLSIVANSGNHPLTIGRAEAWILRSLDNIRNSRPIQSPVRFQSRTTIVEE